MREGGIGSLVLLVRTDMCAGRIGWDMGGRGRLGRGRDLDALVVDAEAGTGASWLFGLGLRPAWTGGGWGDDLDWVSGRAGVADRLVYRTAGALHG